MFEYLVKFKGQRVAVWCVRYTYRGVVKEVNEEALVLEDVHAVESCGRSTNSKVESEDRIPSDLMINLNAIEIVCQPAWA